MEDNQPLSVRELIKLLPELYKSACPEGFGWFVTGMTLLGDDGKEYTDESIVDADDRWIAHMSQHDDQSFAESELIAAMQRCVPSMLDRIAALEACLEQFAKVADAADKNPFGPDPDELKVGVTLSDCREARRILRGE